MKTLIVVSGGDAPGINTVIARYVQLASRAGDLVVGVQSGFEGVLEGRFVDINPLIIELLSSRGGSYLTSSRVPILSEADAEQRLVGILEREQIDHVLMFGGDGSLRHILPLLHNWGIPCIGLPTTIDNDVADTDYTLGHDSACNFAFHAIDSALATAHALPGRIFIIETLGGKTGFLAQAIAFSAGAQAVAIPEYEMRLEWFAERLKTNTAQYGYGLAVICEGVSFVPQLEEAIPRLTGLRLRYVKLGHAQRGGEVSHFDRTVAHTMGKLAYYGFKDNVQIGTVIAKEGQFSLHEGALSGDVKPPPNRKIYTFINEL